MTRIIAGARGGRRIETPKGDGTRPTSDRVREALFSSLESELGGLDDLVVLDLFAGSGALGLEALSRGAATAVFVESDAKAAATITRNLATLDVSGRVARTTAARYLSTAPVGEFDLVFLDPPYMVETSAVAELVSAVRPALATDALIVVERSTRDQFVWPEGIEPLRHKAYGETTLWYGH
ncbi:MAG: 16S rRNA (guanine(966)-N(2))-methyltransferase RsmD [Aeromicrobium sp.]